MTHPQNSDPSPAPLTDFQHHPWRMLYRPLGLMLCVALVGCPEAPPLVSSAADTAELGNPPPSADVAAPRPAETPPPALSDAPGVNGIAGQVLPITAEVELGGVTIGLEVARTPEEQALGLMYRQELSDDRGMVFPFSPPRPVSFWMKNVVISLDMVFVQGGEIVGIAADVPPCAADPCPTYGPGRQVVSYVIELRGGRAAELGLEVGDSVDIEWLTPEDTQSTPTDTE